MSNLIQIKLKRQPLIAFDSKKEEGDNYVSTTPWVSSQRNTMPDTS